MLDGLENQTAHFDIITHPKSTKMKNNLSTLKIYVSVGLLFGFACGFIYGIGGFIYDYIYTGINQGSYLALNALWGMPLIFGIIGLGVGILVLVIYRYAKNKT